MFQNYASPLSARNVSLGKSNITISIMYKTNEDDLYSRCPVKSIEGHKYHVVPEESYYGVRINNNNFATYNAILKIDGENMGKFRIESRGTHTIYRPNHSKRSFVFVADDGDIASSSGVVAGDTKNGLIEVTFIPVKKNLGVYVDEDVDYDRYQPRYFNEHCPTSNSATGKKYKYSLSYDPNTMPNTIDSLYMSDAYGGNNSLSYKSGATVLGDDSDQKFRSAIKYEEITEEKFTMRARLIISSRKKYVSIKTRDDVDDIDDPIPPPIGRYGYL